jgi:ABC-2 type transport system permease protein
MSGNGEKAAADAPSWKHLGGVFKALWKNSLTREAGFQVNFILWLFVELLWFALQLSFCSIIYLQTETINSWSKWEVVLLVGASHFIQQIFQAFFLVNCTQLSELVHTGKLDFILLLPVNPRFLVSFRHVDLGGFFSAASGVAVMFYAAHQLHFVPSEAQMLLFVLTAMAAILIHYSLMFIMATTSFWTVRAHGMVMAYYNLFSVARIPDSACKGLFRGFFTFVIPMLVVASVPAKVVLGKLNSFREVGLIFAMAAVCFGVSHLIWRCALRDYRSASS